MLIAIASGKGGTGKTTVAVNLALSIGAKLVDCDVEEPNANLFLKKDLVRLKEIKTTYPVVDGKKCTHCRKCAKLCEYNALAVLEDQVMVFSQLCHGCGLCAIACPEGAITEEERVLGIIEKSRDDRFMRGLLNIGEAMATPLISGLKEEIDPKETVILDAPPGAACPVIEALEDVDYCVLVTEPTPFGFYDLTIAVELCRKMGVRFGVVINKDGVGNSEVADYCEKEDIPVLLKIPHDREIARLYSKGETIVSGMPEWKERFKELYEEIKK